MNGLIRPWYDDEGGAISVFLLVVLPLLLIIVFGLFALWQVVTVRQAVEAGVFHAARFISAEPPQTDDSRVVRDVARRIITTEVGQSIGVRTQAQRREESMTRAQMLGDVSVQIEDAPTMGRCREAAADSGDREPVITFRVIADVQASVQILPGMPTSEGPSYVVPIRVSREGRVKCAPER